MDKKVSEYLSYLVGNIEKSEKVEEQSERVETNGSESSVDNKKSDNVSSGEKQIYETAVEGINQLSEDAKYIKENYNVKAPVKGTINQESVKKNDSQSNDKIVSMSMQYKEINENDNEDWQKIKKGIEDLYVSWAIIESDLKTKSEVSQDDLDKVNREYR